MTRLRRSLWLGPVVVGLCAFLLLGATIRKSSIIAGSTALIGGTASRVVVTNSAGNLATSSILTDDGSDLTIASGAQILGAISGGTSPPYSFTTVATSGLDYSATFGVEMVFGGAPVMAFLSTSRALMGSSGHLVWNANNFSSASIDVGVKRLGVQAFGVTDGSTGVGDLGLNTTTVGARDAFLSRNLHAAGFLHAQTSFALGAHVVTIGNDGVATSRNTEVLGGARSYYIVDCLDPQGCAVHVSTSMRQAGAIVYLVATSANAVLVEDVADIQHVATAFDMGAADAMQFIFVRTHSGATYFSEVSRSNN